MRRMAKTRPVTYREAADILVHFGDRRIRPLTPGTKEPLNFEYESAADELALLLADDPETDLSDAPLPLLYMFSARLMFCIGVALTRPDDVIGNVPAAASDDLVLRALLGEQVRNTRLPAEWRFRRPAGLGIEPPDRAH